MSNTLLPRHLAGELADALKSARVVNVIGPRQAGKTTLVRDLFGRGRFVTLDDESVLMAVDSDPLGQLEALIGGAANAPLIIDEAQRSKRLALAIKKIVDERRRMGQFVLTGSSNIFATAQVTDSLAGRVRTLTLLPLSTAESHRAGAARLLDWASPGSRPTTLASLPTPATLSRDAHLDLLLEGGYPEMRLLDRRSRQRRYRDYIDTIVDRDVADLLKIRKTDALRRLIDQLAARTGNELNVQALCGAIGLQRPTMEQYLDVLTRLCLLARLGAWASGETRREIRHPKVHMLDTGLAAALRNLAPASFAADSDPTALGGLLESFVYAELVKNLPYQRDDWRLYHWRGDKGREIDILAEAGRRLVAFEVKAAVTVGEDDLRNLRWFKTEGPGRNRPVTGLVIYLGSQPLSFGDGLFGLPLSIFWAFGELTRSSPSASERPHRKAI